MYGGQSKAKSIKSWFTFMAPQIPTGPLLDLLKGLVEVCTVRDLDVPPGKKQIQYSHLLECVVQHPSLKCFVTDHQIKQYYGHKERFEANSSMPPHEQDIVFLDPSEDRHCQLVGGTE